MKITHAAGPRSDGRSRTASRGDVRWPFREAALGTNLTPAEAAALPRQWTSVFDEASINACSLVRVVRPVRRRRDGGRSDVGAVPANRAAVGCGVPCLRTPHAGVLLQHGAAAGLLTCPSESGPNMSPSPGRWLSRRRRTRSRWSGSTAAATRLGGRRNGVRLHLHHAHRPAR